MPRPILAFACIVGLGACVTICVAAEPEITDVRIGWQGHFKRGHWAEVQATITAGDQPLTGELEVVSRDGDGASVAFVCPQPVDLEGGSSGVYTTLVKMGPPQSGLQLRVRRNQLTLLHKALSETEVSGQWQPRERTSARGHRSTSLVLATLGADVGVATAAELLRDALAEEAVVVQLSDANELPKSALGYDAIDCLVLSLAQENPLATLTPQQRDSMLQWQELGGHIVAVAGESASALAQADSPWPELHGVGWKERSPLTGDAGLRAFAGEPLELSPPPKVWHIDIPSAFVLASESGSGSSDRPLAIEYPVGFGSLSLVLMDLSQPPMDTWRGRPRFLAKIIADEAMSSEPQASQGSGRMTHLGYRDLAGQLRMALDQFDNVAPIHFHAVAGALLVYVLLLGPGEYYLLRSAAPRAMHFTWLVFPLVVIGFAGAAIAWGHSAHGKSVKVNQVEVVDLNPLRGQQRGAFWIGLFAPNAQTTSLSARSILPHANVNPAGMQVAWQGLPGEGLGGIDAPLPLLSTRSSQSYETKFGGEDAPAFINRLSLAQSSSKTLAGSWQGTVLVTSDASQLRRGKRFEIEGTFRSLSPVPLTNVFLAYGDYIYRARGEVLPGVILNVANLDGKHLEYFFTRRNLLKEKELATPWNQEETDIARILDIMMFHSALQGRSYTALSHRYHEDLDLTHLLHQGYAVLIGRAETPLVELELDGEPLEDENVRRWTYYRILYPVAPRD